MKKERGEVSREQLRAELTAEIPAGTIQREQEDTKRRSRGKGRAINPRQGAAHSIPVQPARQCGACLVKWE